MRSISANSSARLEPKPRIWRALSSTASPPMAVLSSAREKETLIAQAGQDPALRDLHGDLDLRLVLWPPRPCRQDRGAIMAGHLGIGSVDPGIVTIGVGHGGLEIIADHELRHAAEIPEQAGMHADPIGQALAWAGLGVGVVRGPHRRDEQLHGAHFAGD